MDQKERGEKKRLIAAHHPHTRFRPVIYFQYIKKGVYKQVLEKHEKAKN